MFVTMNRRAFEHENGSGLRPTKSTLPHSDTDEESVSEEFLTDDLYEEEVISEEDFEDHEEEYEEISVEEMSLDDDCSSASGHIPGDTEADCIIEEVEEEESVDDQQLDTCHDKTLMLEFLESDLEEVALDTVETEYAAVASGTAGLEEQSSDCDRSLPTDWTIETVPENEFLEREDTPSVIILDQVIRSLTASSSAVAASDRERRIIQLIGAIKTTKDCTSPEFNLHKGDSLSSSSDLSFLLRVKDFHRARLLRREKHAGGRPWGIFGLYCYLMDLQVDLEWADASASHRTKGQPALSWVEFDASRAKEFGFPYFVSLVMIVWSITLVVGFAWNGWSIAPFSVNPFLGPSPQVLIRMGSLDTSRIVEDREWYRLASPMLLQAGLIQYLINMLSLWFVGGAVERFHGSFETALVFLVGALGGNLCSALMVPQDTSIVGASGGIFGLMAVCLADMFINRDLLSLRRHADATTAFPHGALAWLYVDMAVYLVLGLTLYVDNFAQLGGLFYGICVGIPFLKHLGGTRFIGKQARPNTSNKSLWRHGRYYRLIGRGIGWVVAIAMLVTTSMILAREDQAATVCQHCNYVSCAPFPPFQDSKWWYCDGCDQATATVVTLEAGKLAVQVTCPLDGSVISVPIHAPGHDLQLGSNHLGPQFCRSHCLH